MSRSESGLMQFNRDEKGVLPRCPSPASIPHGARAARRGVSKAFTQLRLDLFRDLIAAAAKLTGAADLASPSLKVIADHIRAGAFLIVDAVIPATKVAATCCGESPAARSVTATTRADETFFAKLVPELAPCEGDAYPELPLKQDHVIRVLQTEEERFAQTLETA